jgi:tetratricopeptide (TPR) repeat protein
MMAVRESRRTRHADDEEARDQWSEPADSDERDDGDNGQVTDRQMVRAPARRSPAPHRVVSGEVFDPRRAIPVGLLRLARNWSETGSVYQAIHAYTEVLIRYPDTGAADAAVEELLILAELLAQQGRYYAALNIFNKLEQLC